MFPPFYAPIVLVGESLDSMRGQLSKAAESVQDDALLAGLADCEEDLAKVQARLRALGTKIFTASQFPLSH